MIRVFHVYFPGRTLALAVTEGLVIVCALVLAAYAQFGPDAGLVLTYEHMLPKVVIASMIGMMFMHYHDLYQSMVLHSLGAAFSRLLQAAGAICVICGALYYAFPVAAFGYELVITWIVLAGLGLSVWRTAFFFVNRSRRLQDRAIFVGDSPLRGLLFQEIESRPELGLRLVGYLNSDSSDDQVGCLRRLGKEADLPTIVEREKVSRIIIGRSVTEIGSVRKRSGHGAVLVQGADELYEAIFDKLPVLAAGLSPRREYRLSRSFLLYKQVTSFILAVIGLVIALPIVIMVALAIRLDSPGPIIFRQKRVGKNGRIFVLYKFRSMRHGADRDGAAPPAQKHDSRFTRVGRFIRRTRLDELPQLWNILRGDMYLVGPRPFTVEMEDELSRKIPNYSDRWLVKPV